MIPKLIRQYAEQLAAQDPDMFYNGFARKGTLDDLRERALQAIRHYKSERDMYKNAQRISKEIADWLKSVEEPSETTVNNLPVA